MRNPDREAVLREIADAENAQRSAENLAERILVDADRAGYLKEPFVFNNQVHKFHKLVDRVRDGCLTYDQGRALLQEFDWLRTPTP